MMDAQQTGERSAGLRKQKGWTQKRLAEHLHISAAAVSKWESGLNFPDLALMEPLAQVLETTAVHLLVLEDAPNEQVVLNVAEMSAQQENRRHRLRYRAVLLGVVCSAMPMLILTIAFLVGTDGLFAELYDIGGMNIGALGLGFTAWIAAGVGLLCDRRVRLVYVCVSLACCALALYIPTLLVDMDFRFGSWATVEDTIAGYNFGALALMLGVGLLNGIIGWGKKKGSRGW